MTNVGRTRTYYSAPPQGHGTSINTLICKDKAIRRFPSVKLEGVVKHYDSFVNLSCISTAAAAFQLGPIDYLIVTLSIP